MQEGRSALSEAAERTASNAKEAYSRMQAATEEATGIFGETFQIARGHSMAMTLKAIDIAQANAEAFFDFFRKVTSVKTMADAVQAQTEYAQKQFEILSGQIKDLQEAGQQAARDVAEPGRAAWEKRAKEQKVN
jgi:phasin